MRAYTPGLDGPNYFPVSQKIHRFDMNHNCNGPKVPAMGWELWGLEAVYYANHYKKKVSEKCAAIDERTRTC